jgi:hypothetical protein
MAQMLAAVVLLVAYAVTLSPMVSTQHCPAQMYSYNRLIKTLVVFYVKARLRRRRRRRR